MRSQLRFIMHPKDEEGFANYLLSDDTVQLIDGPRWQTEQPDTVRTFNNINNTHCLLWSPSDMESLQARYIEAANDWYCTSEYATIAFFRSEIHDHVITEGRISINTSVDISQLSTQCAQQIEKRFKKLKRYIKKEYQNSIVYWCNPTLPLQPANKNRSANPSEKPDSTLWVGPHATRWMQDNQNRRIKQFPSLLVEGAFDHVWNEK